METARQPTTLPLPEPKGDVSAAAKPARKRRPFVVLGLVALAALVAVGAYALVTRGRESTDDAQVTADIVPVSARVSGVLSAVHVHENQAVKRGDLLMELDAADMRARRDQSEAELATAQAQAQAADAQVQIVEATSKGGLTSARAALSGS
ncbi:MAG TPA: biotin/lipoyl-binding protein, partial [Polyangia bacterium]|nr:biotin/lipoyl-binding protein [Polyangia bacterium]